MSPEITPPVPELSVLLVDDDAVDREVVKRAFAQCDSHRARIEEAADYEAAEHCIAHQQYDLYILDYYLGAHCGMDLIDYIHAHHPRAFTLLLTGLDETALQREHAFSRVNAFMAKDAVTPAHLTDVLNGLF